MHKATSIARPRFKHPRRSMVDTVPDSQSGSAAISTCRK
jgi:hypothetical protein